MYNYYKSNRYPIYFYIPVFYPYKTYKFPYSYNTPMYNPDYYNKFIKLKDYGPNPFVVNIDKATKRNTNFRTALWTGENLQVTLMSINVGEDIGLETHPTVDQFIRIEEGQGIVLMGDDKNCLDYRERIYDNFAIMIPAGKWHNIINTGNKPLKLYSIYAPPAHPHGTIHKTKKDAESHNHISQ